MVRVQGQVQQFADDHIEDSLAEVATALERSNDAQGALQAETTVSHMSILERIIGI